MMRRFYLACLLALALTIFIAGSALCAKTLVIRVSDEFDLKSTEATTVSDQVCLPVRNVAETMGAKVKWDSKSGTLTVSGTAGTAVLRLGDTAATINGTKVDFPIAPFMFGNRFFAPLGFYNNFFNMGLVWDPFRQAYRWVFILPPSPYPIPPVIYGPGSGTAQPQPAADAGESRRLVAEVVRVQPGRGNPTITVSSANRVVTYPIARDALILRGRIGGRAVEVPLAEVRPGDRATIQVNERGVVTSIRSQYQEVRGAVRSVTADRIVLDTGRTVRITSQTRVVLPGNAAGRVQDLEAGDVVIASISPVSGEAYLISVQRSTRQTDVQSNIYLNTYGPLAVGDTLRVTFRASQGGRALFTIPGLLTDAQMAETSPGVYEAQYTVKPGDILPSERIKVTFIRPDGERFETLSARPVAIATESAYLPRIISPRTGEIIGSPIVVRGIAKPGSLVQVSVEFRRDIQGVMPIEGLSDIQVVRANADGAWATEPLAATAPFHEQITEMPFDYGILDPLYDFEEYPTVYAITATEIGPDGVAVSSYTVETLKGRGIEVGL